MKINRQKSPYRQIRKLIVAGVLLTVSLFASPLRAEPLVTDRPDQTESSNIVQPGSFQLEGGFSFSKEKDTEDVKTITFPQLLTRIGITPNFEFRISGDGFIYLIREGQDNISNGSDLEVGGKLLLFSQSGFLPETATIFALSIPTGGKQVTSDGVDPSGVLIFSWDLPKDFGLGVNVAFASPTQGEGSQNRIFEATTTIALGIPITDKLGAFVEYFGTVAAEGAQDAHSMDGGFTYLIDDDLQLDLSGGVGLTEAAPDFFVGLGASWRFRFAGASRTQGNSNVLRTAAR